MDFAKLRFALHSGPGISTQEYKASQKWVAQRYEVNSNHSWSQIIVFFSTDEFQALDNFFKLWEEFKGEQDLRNHVYNSWS